MCQNMEKKNIEKQGRLINKSKLYFLTFFAFLTIFGALLSLKLQKQYSNSRFNNLESKQGIQIKDLSIFDSQNSHQQEIQQEKFVKNKFLKNRNLQANQIDEHPLHGASSNYIQKNKLSFVPTSYIQTQLDPAVQNSDIITLNVKIPQVGSFEFQSSQTVNTPNYIQNNQNTVQNLFFPTNMPSSFDNTNYWQRVVQNANQNSVKNQFYTNIPNQKIQKFPQQSYYSSTPSNAFISHTTSLTYKEIDFAKRLSKMQQQNQYEFLKNQERLYYEKKYNISQYEEQPFCIVIPSFNNAALNRYMHNLNSILQQDYSNYHIVFIDDASDDGTSEKVRQFAYNHQISQAKLKIITNTQRTMAMPNIYRAAHQFCQPHEIFMIIDGDDELIGTQILKLYNALFQKNDYWLVYTNFITTYGSIGYSRAYSPGIVQNKLFRQAGFVISHLRAFYTKLFTLIKQQDLKDDDGSWFRAANDVAMYMPILQMSQKKFSYVPQICYLYNSNTGLNNHLVKRQQQRENEMKIKSRERYPTLSDLFTETEKQNLKNSMGQKIPLKDLNLPFPYNEVKKFKWQ